MKSKKKSAPKKSHPVTPFHIARELASLDRIAKDYALSPEAHAKWAKKLVEKLEAAA